jgi:PAS domain S-box-containing protein
MASPVRDGSESRSLQVGSDEDIILDSVPAMVWFKDRENRIVRANRAAALSIGKTPEEIAGVSTYDLYPEQAEDYYEDDLEVINSGCAKRGIIETITIASGEKRWVRTDKIPYHDAEGNIRGVIVFAVDITDHKLAEAALEGTRDELEKRVQERTAELAGTVESLRSEIAERRQIEERLALALWATDLGLWDWNAITDALVYDRRWAEFLGYEPDEIEPHLQHWQSRVHPDDLPLVMKTLNAHVRDKTSPNYESEHRIRTRSGEYRWILARGQVAEWTPEGLAKRVIGTFRDIHRPQDGRRADAPLTCGVAHVLRPYRRRQPPSSHEGPVRLLVVLPTLIMRRGRASPDALRMWGCSTRPNKSVRKRCVPRACCIACAPLRVRTRSRARRRTSTTWCATRRISSSRTRFGTRFGCICPSMKGYRRSTSMPFRSSR